MCAGCSETWHLQARGSMGPSPSWHAYFSWFSFLFTDWSLPHGLWKVLFCKGGRATTPSDSAFLQACWILFRSEKKKKVFYVQENKVKLQNRVLKSDILCFPLIINDQSRSQSEHNWRYLKQLKAILWAALTAVPVGRQGLGQVPGLGVEVPSDMFTSSCLHGDVAVYESSAPGSRWKWL